ncbi:MAG: HigA family addiction module antitoxin [Nitrosomonadaceae bacterium]
MTEHTITEKPDRVPTHPGFLLADVLEDTSLPVLRFAKGIHLSRQQVHKILKGSAPITAEVAVKMGRFLGNGPDLWMNMQVKYDLWKAEQTVDEEIQPYSAAS